MLNYGIIGNCRTCALVSSEGSIDWACFPQFDSPSAFAKIIDDKKGGHFDIKPAGNYKVTQKYIEDTNVLETSFKARGNAFRIIDFFPCYMEGGALRSKEELHRLLIVEKGKPVLKISYKPKLDYARGTTKVKTTKKAIIAANGRHKLHLHSNLELKGLSKKDVALSEDSFFVLSWDGQEKDCSTELVKEEMEKTVNYWRDYASMGSLPNFYRKTLTRSILVLKLITFHESGGIVSSATASLPEIIGGERNWDKRYCWLRNQASAIDALTHACLFDEAVSVMKFLLSVGTAHMMKGDTHGFGMQSIYRPHGETFLDEHVLEHMAGYRSSKPVRIGNDAHKQKQIGVFGEVLDAFHKFFLVHGYVENMMNSQLMLIKRMVEHVAKHWGEKDSGIWEFRKTEEHFTSSKLMAWVAVDRGIKLLEAFDPSSSTEELERIRGEMRGDIMNNYNKRIDAFTAFPRSRDFDASLLLMSYYGFLKPDDPKFVDTVNAIERELQSGPFLKRHKIEDGFGRPKNAFIFCTLWLIDALFAMGEIVKAKILFEKVLRYSNHLGLLSEGMDLTRHEMAGNFPDAQAHISLISMASKLSREEPERRPSQMRFIE